MAEETALCPPYAQTAAASGRRSQIRLRSVLVHLHHVGPGTVVVAAGDGGLDERHTGSAVHHIRVRVGGGHRLPVPGTDVELDRLVEVGQRLVEAFRMAA